MAPSGKGKRPRPTSTSSHFPFAPETATKWFTTSALTWLCLGFAQLTCYSPRKGCSIVTTHLVGYKCPNEFLPIIETLYGGILSCGHFVALNRPWIALLIEQIVGIVGEIGLYPQDAEEV